MRKNLPLLEGYRERNRSQHFQTVFNQFNGLRKCAIWVQDNEVQTKNIYDFSIRIREDTYILKPFVFNPIEWKNKVVTTNFADYDGLCDRRFVCDRIYVNDFVRSLVEHYYFDDYSEMSQWKNPEQLLRQLVDKLGIPLLILNFCSFPVQTIRYLHNSTHWVIDDGTVGMFFLRVKSYNDIYNDSVTCITEFN